MVKQLIQKRGLNYRKFFLENEKIIVETKTIRTYQKYEVKLVDLGFNKLYQADNTYLGKIAAMVCILLPISLFLINLFQNKFPVKELSINFFLWFALAAFFYFKQHNDDILLIGGKKNLVFFRDIPDEIEVLEFIDIIIMTTKKHLVDKYAQFDKNTFEQDFYNRLSYLKNNDIITNLEFDNLYNEFKFSRLIKISHIDVHLN